MEKDQSEKGRNKWWQGNHRTANPADWFRSTWPFVKTGESRKTGCKSRDRTITNPPKCRGGSFESSWKFVVKILPSPGHFSCFSYFIPVCSLFDCFSSSNFHNRMRFYAHFSLFPTGHSTEYNDPSLTEKPVWKFGHIPHCASLPWSIH